MRRFLIPVLFLASFPAVGQSIHVDFVAARGTDVANGFFEWAPLDTIIYRSVDGLGYGKTLWNIIGAISLNHQTPIAMTDVRLEVMNNTFIDAPIPNSLIGDQITLFGTASNGSGLTSVQNFYFRDETGLLLSSVIQPTAQITFSAFNSVRADLFQPGSPDADTFQIISWNVISTVPEPETIFLFGIGILVIGIRRASLGKP